MGDQSGKARHSSNGSCMQHLTQIPTDSSKEKANSKIMQIAKAKKSKRRKEKKATSAAYRYLEIGV